MVDYYALSPDEVLDSVKSSVSGLSDGEAAQRLSSFGPNELKKEGGHAALRIFLEQFSNFLILLLVVAAGISFVAGEILDSIAMAVIILLTVFLGFFQEYRAERAIQALKRISAPSAVVVRQGEVKKIPSRELVPGDVILLEEGEIIPADARVLEVSSLQVDEASLTGESVPSKKVVDPYPVGTSVADQENMVFTGTVVTYGKGKAVVAATGMATELGKIASNIQETREEKTPLQKKFEVMSKQIGIATLVLVGIVFVMSLVTRSDGKVQLMPLFIFALSLAVAAVPSSLPAIVTIGLSLGAKALAKKNMIIKKLPAAESLGQVTMICSDKTGTLTKNQMTVTKVYVDSRLVEVTGSGYEPKGKFIEAGKEIDPDELSLLLRIGELCNNAKLHEGEGRWEVIGDPTEGALLVLGRKSGLPVDGYAEVAELPFDADRKRMTKVFRGKDGLEAYVKGAPDLMLKICTHIQERGRVRRLTEKDRARMLAMNNRFAEQALRVLALAYRKVAPAKSYALAAVEKDLVLVGLVGMMDPPREEVPEAVAKCKAAGIQVMVITGDYALTARAVAKQIGLFEEGDLVLSGEDLERMDDEELESRIHHVRIISRALPIQKSRIVTLLKRQGHIVVMTGDGVNDAPALKKADVGVAMGITGSDVAKEVSEVTLVDDNFATIVNGIAEGRNIYDKIIKSTRYLLSCNMGEIATVFFAIMLRMPLPLIPLQILLMNLVTDGLPALGLSVEAQDDDVMRRKPRNPKGRPLTRNTLLFILLFGLIMAAGTLWIFHRYGAGAVTEEELRLPRTIAFSTLVMFEMFAVLGSRSLHAFKKLNPFSNRWLFAAVLSSIAIQAAIIYVSPLQSVFGTVPLSAIQVIEILAVASVGFVVMELSKFFLDKETSAS
ncbi:MAG: cation-translocating P-type ATPase [Nanoarchaeota archaeon]